MPVRKKDIPRLIEEIRSLRSLVEKRSGIFRRLDFSFHLRLVVLLMGAFVITACLLMHFLLAHYSTFSAIPALIRISFLIAGILILVSLAMMKISKLGRGARKIDPSYRISNLIRDFMLLPPFLHSYLVWLVVLATLTTVIISAKQYALLVPLLSFTIAFMLNLLGGIIERKTYLFTGYWLMAGGLLYFVFPAVPALITAAISIGGGFFLFGIISYIAPLVKTEKSA